MAKNQHRNLTGDALHNPKGFDGASNGTKPVKDATGALDWITETQLPKALDYVSAQSAPPTEVTGDVYLIDTTGTAYDINTIAWQSGNTIRIAFNGSPDLSAVAADDYFITSGNGNSSNDGTFIITTVNDGSDYIEITNNDRSDATDDEATDAVGTGYYTLAEWDAVSKVSHVTFDGSIWSSITPSEGQSSYDVALGAIRVFDGTDWSSSLASGGVTGSGTTNYLARWTPSGSALGNSVIYDNGSTVGIGSTGGTAIQLTVDGGSSAREGINLSTAYTGVSANYGIKTTHSPTGSAVATGIRSVVDTSTGVKIGIDSYIGATTTLPTGDIGVTSYCGNADRDNYSYWGKISASNTNDNYGLYLDVANAGSGDAYGVYQAGANAKNYFAGAMQFDTAAAATGYVWTATDANGNGDWAAASGGGGGGDVSKVGTPVDNQIGVWTGDGTIEGDASLTWDASTLLVKGSGTTSGTSSFKCLDSGGANMFEVKDNGHTQAHEGFSSGVSHTITTMGTSNFVLGGSNTFHSGVYSGTLGYNNEISSFTNQSQLIGGSNETNKNYTQMLGMNNTNTGSHYNVLVGQSLTSGGDSYQYLFGRTLNTSNASQYGQGVFMGYGSPSIGAANNGTTNEQNIGLGLGSLNKFVAGKAGAGDGIVYISNYGNQNTEPTTDCTDSVALWVRDGADGKGGLVIKAEDGTRHFLGDFSVIGGDYSDAESDKTLIVKGTGTTSGTSSLKTTDSGGNATLEVLDNGTVKSTGQIGSSAGATPNTETPSGTTETIDWDNGNYQVLDLESASGNVTLTLSNPVAGFAYFIEIRQDSTTPLDVIFPSSVKFAGETAPYTLDVSTGANAVDAVSLAWNGSEYIASFSQNHG